MNRNTFAFLFLMVVVCSTVWAANPADLTCFYHFQPNPFFMAAYDGGPSWVYASLPVSGRSSASVYPWWNEGCTRNETELVYAQKANNHLEIAWSSVLITEDRKSDTKSTIFTDWHQGKIGLSLAVPFDGDLRYGVKYQANSLTTFFATFCENGSKPTLGFMLRKSSCRFDLAADLQNHIEWFRVSKPIDTKSGTFGPELRLKFAESETSIGIRLSFCPK